MRELPSGTVTLLFSDIEGSTRLLHQLGERYPEALAEHRRLMREAFAAHGGVEVDTQGDAFLVAFPTAKGAVAAAAQAQLSLAQHEWPEGVELRVRMGLHTGEPILTGEGYAGLDLHKGARVMAAGHGGQVLVSKETRELLDGDLLDGLSLRDLGEHKLKDLEGPQWLFQLELPELTSDFPPLKSLNNTNLPAEASSLVGRERELEELSQLLAYGDVRLVTLTGPGGTGKTRLALRVAAELIERFRNGVFLVSLAALTDPQLVLPTIAQTLGVREQPGTPLAETLAAELGEKRLLLLLDNFEQLLAAASQLAQLLAQAPRLKLIVTSRERLNVAAEHEYAVQPLASGDALTLFAERARQAKAGFALDGDRAVVEAICARLDRLPLAIELAAARVRLFPPQALLSRLEQRLPLLTGGARDLPERQQTLKAAIGWSYDLLSEEEQRLFARLSVFAGGCNLEAAERVCEAEFETLASLVDKSLLRQEETEESEPRFSMLETIREYAAEKLEQTGEAQELRRRHAEYFLALAEEAEPELRTGEQGRWFERLEEEHDNLRAALARGLEEKECDSAMRLAAALADFWDARGHFSEARRWLDAALACSEELAGSPRAKVLDAAGLFALRQGDFKAAERLHAEAAERLEQLGDRAGAARALAHVAFTRLSLGAPLDEAEHVGERALAFARESRETWTVACALTALGGVAVERGDVARASELHSEALTLLRQLGDERNSAGVLINLSVAAIEEGAYDRAERLLEEALPLARKFDDPDFMSGVLLNRAVAALCRGRAEEARPLLHEGLELARKLGSSYDIAAYLAGLAAVAVDRGEVDRGARLLGACEAVLERAGAALGSTERRLQERTREALADALGHERMAGGLAEGRSMAPDEAIAYALAESPAPAELAARGG